jgi:hypothetical protein
MKIARNLLLDYQAACKMLPNVKPRTVTNILNSLLDSIMNQIDFRNMTADTPKPTIEYCGIMLSSSDIHNIRDATDFGRIKITPQGAKTLIALYRAGGLFSDRDKKAKVEPVHDELIAYADSEAALMDKTLAKNEVERKAEEVRIERINNPRGVSVKDFTYSLLNDIFFAHVGKCTGQQKMNIGGIPVTKTVLAHHSNSGKSRDFEVIFEFTDESGELKTISKSSMYAENRRNDASRNHGLPNSRRYQ